MKINIKTQIPGPKSFKLLSNFKQFNGGWMSPHPYVHSRMGEGSYFTDIDGNTFLDFASQIASNPLGYNHPAMVEVLQNYSNLTPIKYGGQDFLVKEHLGMLEELLAIVPKELNSAFLTNSGAEAVENSIKIAMRRQKSTRFGVSFENGWHGRTLGALSLTNSKVIQKKYYLSLPVRRLPYDNTAGEKLQRLLECEAAPDEIGFVIIEPIQGEGGYYVAQKEMVQSVRKITKQHDIPFISDEVQCGIGRTGKWWGIENFGVSPDIIASAKSLQVGATIANKKYFPEPGGISSTWGGGHVIDLAMGIAIIQTIKRDRLLLHNQKIGNYITKNLHELSYKHNDVTNARGLGLMQAFDLPNGEYRNAFVYESAKRGLVVLPCGKTGIRLIPPYIVTENEVDEAMGVFNGVLSVCKKRRFTMFGDYVRCV